MLDADSMLADRVLSIIPALRALLRGEFPEPADQLRRNVAAHSRAKGLRISTAKSGDLRAAQKGPRLGPAAVSALRGDAAVFVPHSDLDPARKTLEAGKAPEGLGFVFNLEATTFWQGNIHHVIGWYRLEADVFEAEAYFKNNEGYNNCYHEAFLQLPQGPRLPGLGPRSPGLLPGRGLPHVRRRCSQLATTPPRVARVARRW